MSPETPPAPSFLDRLNSLNIGRERLGTEPVLHVLEMLGYPQEITPTIHIAGTNGKGSVTHMLAAGMTSQGLSVGSIHSPHLTHPRERICLDNQPLHTAQFERYGQQLWEKLERLIGPYIINKESVISTEANGEVEKSVPVLTHKTNAEPLTLTLSPRGEGINPEWPTYFEFMVILAFWIFKQENVDLIILETGLGGRLDATNVVSHPLLTAITSIAWDHADRLGDSLDAIAREKAGILRAGVPLVIGPNIHEEARLAIMEEANTKRVDDLIETTSDPLHIQTPRNDQGQQVIRNMVSQDVIRLGLLGDFQKDNLATVLACANILQRFEILTDMAAFLTALETTQYPGRFDYRPEHKLLLDGAHNDAGLKSLSKSIQDCFPEHALFWMLSMRNNRDTASLLKMLKHFSSQTYGVVLTMPSLDQAHLFHDPLHLRRLIRDQLPELERVPIWTASEPESAWWMLSRLMHGHASSQAIHEPALTICAGSLYQLGRVYELLVAH
jgi:dihydrofolate synthase / folylpolyglutamate synthase